MKVKLLTLFCALLMAGVSPAARPQDPAPVEPAPAQTAAASQGPVFKARTDLVVLHVNVFDKRSDAVPHLPQSAFRVVENGLPRDITFFSDADVPVAVGLVFDNSTSMLTRRKMALAGATAFADSSHPEDEVFAVVFNERVRFGLPDGVPFTQVRSMIYSALSRYPPGGMTALYDAVIAALDHLQQAHHQKKVLIVLSDGDDNASRHLKADMLRRARRYDTLIYTVYTGDVTATSGDPGVLRNLAETTGGVAYTPRSEVEVVRAFRESADNIRRGYSIGYVPAPTREDGEYRSVKVVVTMAGRKLTVRARDGYTASLSSNPE